MRLGLIACAFALTLLAAACGDGAGGEPDSDATAAAPTPFPQSLISGTMLTPDDVGPGYEVAILTNPPGPTGRSVNATFKNENAFIQSSVVHFPDKEERDRMFIRNRQVSAAFGQREENFQVEGLDIAFREIIFNPPGQSTWATLGDNWIVYVQTSALGTPPDPRMSDPAYLGELARKVSERLNRLIADPDSITPLPSIVEATFPPVLGTPEPTASPAP